MIIEAAKFSNGVFFMLVVKNIPLNEVRILVMDTIGALDSHSVSLSEHQGENPRNKGVKIMIPKDAISDYNLGRVVWELVKLEGLF